MLMADWTGELARERMAELHRQAERQRLVRLARVQHRGGTGGVWRGRRWLVGWLKGSGAGPMVEPSTAPSAPGWPASSHRHRPAGHIGAVAVGSKHADYMLMVKA